MQGLTILQESIRTLPMSPGVYRMLDQDGNPLYIGKARNLKRRVASYTNKKNHSSRIALMIDATKTLDITITKTEVEALLLESNLIKKQRPRYNILLRDDKSFPYIVIRRNHPWAQITKHRGARNAKAEYFGPFASANSVNRALSALQKAFPLRSCSDSVFSNRTRPCLQYQIRRCTAPCVGRIDKNSYEQIVQEARNFLKGQSSDVQKKLSDQMADAANQKDYEAAASYRDRLQALTYIQSRQYINVTTIKEADVIGLYLDSGSACVHLNFYRSGQNYGSRAFFPVNIGNSTEIDVITAFVSQFYESHNPPKLILTNHSVKERDLLEKALSAKANHSVSIQCPKKGTKASAVNYSFENAQSALLRRIAENKTQRKLISNLAQILELENTPSRIEVYDNSHTSGSYAVGVMIVAGPEGFMRSHYRKFNIKKVNLSRGDDYGMLEEVLSRRFKRLLGETQTGKYPDLIIIDGGVGQLNTAAKILSKYNVDNVSLASIAKGKNRKSGREKIYIPNKEVKILDFNDSTFHFLQRLRDEAHRFAITTHRARRSKQIRRSPLDQISGIGPGRKRALLYHFGSAKKVSRAGLSDLERVEGINKVLAQSIYDYFHSSG